MLPLDHLPFRTPDTARLAAAFESLGFTVSAPGAYTSPDVPDARWPNRCVFLRRGWFDLLAEPDADPDHVLGPGGALFRADDLETAVASLDGLRARAPYRLERRWDEDLGLPPETFRLFDLRERVAPIPLAVIEHPYPCPDILPSWLEHENGALEVAGLTFAGAPGPVTDQTSASLDLSRFEYLSVEAFAEAFGPDAPPIAVRVRVESLERAAEALERGGVRYTEAGSRLIAFAAASLTCPFMFFA